MSRKKLTLEEVLLSFIEKHGNRYDYCEFKYCGFDVSSTIICKDHGRFSQSPSVHIRRSGCPSCAGNHRYTTEEVIALFRLKHKDRYDYSKFIYVSAHVDGVIICREHGEFLQTPNNHKRGANCPYCAGVIFTREQMIAAYNKTHNNKYDYSKFIYVNAITKAIIICPTHGEFEIHPNDHQQGQGCPDCCSSTGETMISRILSEMSISFETQKKYVGCKNVLQLPFDFYLPDYNLLIEYDGIQHFQPIKRFGGDFGFDRVKKTDNIKNNFCFKNGINLLRIPYTEIKNLESVISNAINKNKELLTHLMKDNKNEN